MLATDILRPEAFNALPEADRIAWLARMEWVSRAHKHQIPPPLEQDWTVWLLLAGRGAGKTRCAAEALWWWAWTEPGARCLVLAPTSNDIKHTCYEGASGLLACIPPALIKDYNKQDHLITLVNGSTIRGISADSFERLRGPQFHYCFVAGTMVLMVDGSQKAIETIEAGDWVQTRFGPRRVRGAGKSVNPNECVTIRAGQSSLTGTIDHPILVNGSWVPMGQIKVGDQLCTASSLMGSLGIAGHLGTSITRGADTFIGMSGSRRTDPSRKIWSCITSTATLRTTISSIWNLWESQIISGCTRLRDCLLKISAGLQVNLSNLAGLIDPDNAFNAAASSPQGRLLVWASSALASAGNCGATTHSFLKSAAASPADQDTLQKDRFKSTAQRTATTSLQAGRNVSLESIRVESVESLPNQPTFNLNVEGDHEYIANGFVVHNCWSDELAAFQYLGPGEAWDMMMLGLRLGDRPRVIATTTPKNKDLILDLLSREGDDVIVDRASTYDNIDNLSSTFSRQLEQYKGSKLYQQEVLGEIVDLEDGKVVSRDMFKLWPADRAFPKFEYIIQSYDCAFSEKEHNDPTAMTTWGVFKPQDGPMSVLLIDCWADHLTFPQLKPKVLEEWRVSYGEGKDAKRPDLILVEDKAAGISLIQELRHMHLPVRAWNPGRADKMQRLQITASIFTTGRVWLPESSVKKGYVKDWAEGFLSQLCSFPDATHDDYVDSTTQAIRYLKDTAWLDINPEPRYDDDDYVDARPKRTNPYAV